MRIRRIAILIDGGFFIKRLHHIVDDHFCSTPAQIAESARNLCKRHVQRLIGEGDLGLFGRWAFEKFKDVYEIDREFRSLIDRAFEQQGVEPTAKNREAAV